MNLVKQDQIIPLSVTLANAFRNDPLQCYVFPDPKERAEKSPAHFEAVLRYGYSFGEVYCSGNLEGAVVWLKPGETEITPEKAEAGGLAAIPELLGEAAAERFFSVMDFLDPYHKMDAPEPHWYTMVIGVDPAFSGKGLGRALMDSVLKKAAMDKVPVYLETAEPKR